MLIRRTHYFILTFACLLCVIASLCYLNILSPTLLQLQRLQKERAWRADHSHIVRFTKDRIPPAFNSNLLSQILSKEQARHHLSLQTLNLSPLRLLSTTFTSTYTELYHLLIDLLDSEMPYCTALLLEKISGKRLISTTLQCGPADAP